MVVVFNNYGGYMNEDEKIRQAISIINKGSCTGIGCFECLFKIECGSCLRLSVNSVNDLVFVSKVKMYLRSVKLIKLNNI